jgi:hypothetical protein
MWLGGSDLKVEGTFVWEHSGNPVTYTHWGGNAPDNNGDNEDCIHMRCSLANGEWNDGICTWTAYPPQSAMCEVLFPCTSY